MRGLIEGRARRPGAVKAYGLRGRLAFQARGRGVWLGGRGLVFSGRLLVWRRRGDLRDFRTRQQSRRVGPGGGGRLHRVRGPRTDGK